MIFSMKNVFFFQCLFMILNARTSIYIQLLVIYIFQYIHHIFSFNSYVTDLSHFPISWEEPHYTK